MSDQDSKISDKLDKIIDDLTTIKIDMVKEIGNINAVLASQHESLKDHIRRTEILEDKIAPLEKHDAMGVGIIKFLSAGGILAGVIKAILMLLK